MIDHPKYGKKESGRTNKEQSIFGLVGFILSVVGVVLWGIRGFILWIISLILCIIGCLEEDKAHGFAIAGNIISFICLILSLLSIVFLKTLLNGLI